jgi:hypothetical protein
VEHCQALAYPYTGLPPRQHPPVINRPHNRPYGRSFASSLRRLTVKVGKDGDASTAPGFATLVGRQREKKQSRDLVERFTKKSLPTLPLALPSCPSPPRSPLRALGPCPTAAPKWGSLLMSLADARKLVPLSQKEYMAVRGIFEACCPPAPTPE